MPSSAPLFAATLSDLDDKPVALERYKGKPLVVNFWARWCGPCRAEIPELIKFRAAHKGKIEVLGIGIEDKADSAKEFAKAYEMDYPVFVAKEKGIPLMQAMQARYPDVLFTGVKFGEDLAGAYAEADVFVFPSNTDTFGNTILEALASGIPVAAYPVTGPADIIPAASGAGALDEDLRTACLAALERSREEARHLAEGYTWQAATKQFLDNVIEAKTQAKRRRLSRRLPVRPAGA